MVIRAGQRADLNLGCVACDGPSPDLLGQRDDDGRGCGRVDEASGFLSAAQGVIASANACLTLIVLITVLVAVLITVTVPDSQLAT